MPGLDGNVVVLLALNEPADNVFPTDRADSLDDMGGDAASTPALTVPAVVELDGGARGREFGTDEGLVSTGDDGDRLIRDATIEVRARLDSPAVNGTYTLCARGLSGSSAERRLYGLHVVVTGAPGAPLYTLQMFWEESGGAVATVPGKQFELPGGLVYFSAARRWVSPTEVEISYAVNGEDIGTVTSSDGVIAGGVAGSFTVGCRGDGAGNYENFWDGPIDYVRISDIPRSVEERRQVALLDMIYKARAYEIVRALQPPSIDGRGVWSQDPSSRIQRWLQNEGAALAEALSKLAELREDFYPGRAWSKLADWERVTKLFPKPGDSIATRRNRVLAHLQTQHGFSVAAVKLALEGPFALASDDIEILEYENLVEDDFAAAGISDIWIDSPGNGTTAVVAGELQLDLGSGDDGRFESMGMPHLSQKFQGAWPHGDPFFGVDVTLKIAGVTVPLSTLVGIIVYDTRHADSSTEAYQHQAIALGIYNDGGTNKIVWMVYDDEAWGAVQVLETPAPSLPVWLRLRNDGGGDWAAFWSVNGPDDVSNETAIATGITDFTEAGPAIVARVEAVAGAAQLVADDWRAWMPRGTAPFSWYAYRDPALPGTPDMPGADSVVQRLKPAHTDAHACSATAALCDDDDSRCDQTPLGA
jgi:hypothetical protein